MSSSTPTLSISHPKFTLPCRAASAAAPATPNAHGPSAPLEDPHAPADFMRHLDDALAEAGVQRGPGVPLLSELKMEKQEKAKAKRERRAKEKAEKAAKLQAQAQAAAKLQAQADDDDEHAGAAPRPPRVSAPAAAAVPDVAADRAAELAAQKAKKAAEVEAARQAKKAKKAKQKKEAERRKKDKLDLTQRPELQPSLPLKMLLNNYIERKRWESTVHASYAAAFRSKEGQICLHAMGDFSHAGYHMPGSPPGAGGRTMRRCLGQDPNNITLLVHEFRTSITCHNCGSPMKNAIINGQPVSGGGARARVFMVVWRGGELSLLFLGSDPPITKMPIYKLWYSVEP